MKQAFNSIGIITKTEKPGMVDTLDILIAYLKGENKSVAVSEEVIRLLRDPELKVKSHQDLAKDCDLIIVVGGDGSFLHAAHDIVDFETPMIGVNRGTLGFLTDINPQELSRQLDAVFSGEYFEEKRFLLDIEVHENNRAVARDCALNEFLLLPNVNPQMVDFELYLDDEFVCRERSDGLVVATTTGSTAYALSGGGPILHPELDVITLVPMFPHTLSSRPIVVSANHTLRIEITHSNRRTPRTSCDGSDCHDVAIGSQILIKKKQKHLRLIHPKDYDYFDALRSKLHWGKRHYHEA